MVDSDSVGNTIGVDMPLGERRNGADMRTSGERLVAKMQELGWSKKRLARESQLSYATIDRMCKGHNEGYIDTWIRACNVMGVGLTEVLQGGEDFDGE